MGDRPEARDALEGVGFAIGGDCLREGAEGKGNGNSKLRLGRRWERTG